MKKQPIPKTGTKKSSPEPTPRQSAEKDADDLVHSEPKEVPGAETGEEDPDDIVHRPKPHAGTISKEDSLEDPDDLVHGYRDEQDE